MTDTSFISLCRKIRYRLFLLKEAHDSNWPENILKVRFDSEITPLLKEVEQLLTECAKERPSLAKSRYWPKWWQRLLEKP